MKNSRIRISLIAAVFIAACSFTSAFSREVKTIAVLGFVNLGNKSDASINKTVTRSLITFLSKIPEIDITSYEAVEKAAADNKYWESKSFNPDAAVDMGLSLAAAEVVSGDYTVNHKKGMVTINVYVYDTASASMKLNRQYTGEAGLELFDTIDRLIRNVSTLLAGRPIRMGRLEIEIEGTNSYKLNINGKFQKKISKTESYSESEIAEEPLDVTLTVPATEEVIYSTNISIGNGTTVNLTYNPNRQTEVSGPEGEIPEQTDRAGIAVMDFESKTGTSTKDLLTLAEVLRTELAKTGQFKVMQKKEMNNMLKGAKFETSDPASDSDNRARLKLGKVLKEKFAVTGVIDTAFGNISMNIQLIDLETGEILMTETQSCSEDSVFKEIHEIALDIAGKISDRETENTGLKIKAYKSPK